MLHRLMHFPVVFLAFFFLLLAAGDGRFTSRAAPPGAPAKHGLAGNYYVGRSGWGSDTPPEGFLQIWTDQNDFRLPRTFTPPAATRVDPQVAFGQGKGFKVGENGPPVIWWPTGYAVPPDWARWHSPAAKPWDDFVAAIWKGYIHLPKAGTYYFGTVSNGSSAVYLNQARVALNGLGGGVLNSDAFTYAKEEVLDFASKLGKEGDRRYQYVVPVTIDGPGDLPIEVRYNANTAPSGWGSLALGIDLFWVTPDSPRDANGKPVASIVPSEALYTEAPGPIEKPIVRSANSTISADFLDFYFPSDKSVTVTVRLADKDGNPVPGKRVSLATVGAVGQGYPDEIVQPEKPTDEQGETTGKIRVNKSYPVPHDTAIFATDVTDLVDAGQVGHVTFQKIQAGSFFPDSFSPYYDPHAPEVDPMPLQVGRQVTVKMPLVNRNNYAADLDVIFEIHGWNIGAGDWQEIGRVKNVRLQPGEHKEVSITWTPDQSTGHICFRVGVNATKIAAARPSSQALSATLLPLSFQQGGSAQKGTEANGGYVHSNKGAVQPQPNPCTRWNTDIAPPIAAPLDVFLAGGMCELAKRNAAIYRAKSEELSKAADDAAAAGNYKQAGDLKNQALNYGYAADCDEQFLRDCQKGANSPSSGPGQAEKDAATARIPQDEKNESVAYAWVSQCRQHPQSNDKAFCDAAEQGYEKALAQLTSDLQLAHEPPQASYQRLAVAASDTPSAYTDSVRVSLERYRGAQAAGDTEWMARHLTAMRLYEKRLADSLRHRAAELEQQAQSLRLDDPEALATQQAQLDKAWPDLVKGDLISSDQRQKLAALGFTETQLNNSLQRLRSLKQPPKLAGPRTTLLDSASTEKEFADVWQRASEMPVGTGAEGQRSGPLSQTYAVANPHDRQETMDLFIRPISIPADWKLSIVNAEEDQGGQQTGKPGGTQPRYPVHELDPGKHYNITLPAMTETKVASVVIPVGEVGARTTARWAVEGKIGNELIGGMVHEMNVPYIIPDLQLPPVGSKEVEEEVPAPSRMRLYLAVAVAGALIIGMLLFFLIFWRRRRGTDTSAPS